MVVVLVRWRRMQRRRRIEVLEVVVARVVVIAVIVFHHARRMSSPLFHGSHRARVVVAVRAVATTAAVWKAWEEEEGEGYGGEGLARPEEEEVAKCRQSYGRSGTIKYCWHNSFRHFGWRYTVLR